jgi:hypothetical protein
MQTIKLTGIVAMPYEAFKTEHNQRAANQTSMAGSS